MGHTGNEIDQLFSILCRQFKADIPTLEILKEKITAAPIKPKPICRSLDFIYDWKSFIEDKLTNPTLKYHSKYNSFLWKIEICEGNRCIKFFGKKLPQDTQLVPRSGIRLTEDNIDFENGVGAAEYRLEVAKFDEILRGIHLYVSKLPLQEKTSWDRLRDNLKSLPRRSEGFPKMKLLNLPQQQLEVLQVPEYLMDDVDNVGTELTGDKYPVEIDEGDFNSDRS